MLKQDYIQTGIDIITSFFGSLFGGSNSSYSSTQEQFVTINGTNDYTPETFKDDKSAFILDYSNGDLYFGYDGDRDVGDEVLVANIDDAHPYGDKLVDMHPDQIIIVDSFDTLL